MGAKSFATKVVRWLSVLILVALCSTQVVAEEPVDRDSTARIREDFVLNLPVQRQDSFRETPYGWAAWAFDQVRNEALAASLTLSFMAATTVGRHALQDLLDNRAINILRLYGLLIAEVGVDALTSRYWGEFVYRSGINLLGWLGADYLGYLPALGLRYLAVHGALLAETLPEIKQGWQPHFSGVQQLACLGSPVCAAVPVYYHIPDAEHPSTTIAPWLSLAFSEPEPPQSVPTMAADNPMEQALLDVWSWAREQGVDALHLYPSMEDERLKLHVQPWQYGRPGAMLELPGQYGGGSRAVWWTQSFQRPLTPKDQGYQQVNPLHYEILVRLPTLLSGESVTPTVIAGTVLASTAPNDLSSTLLAIDAGEWGGVIADNHFSQGYNIPDLYLDLHQPFDKLLKRALVTLAQQRGPAPRRGFGKLLERVIRTTLYRAVFGWGLNRFLAAQSTRVSGPHTRDHGNVPQRRAPLLIPEEIETNPIEENREVLAGARLNSVLLRKLEAEEVPVVDSSVRHTLVLGQPRAGKTSFIKHLAGQEPALVSGVGLEPQTYEPMDVEGFDKPVVFSELSLKLSSIEERNSYQALVAQIKRADNVVWCGDLQHFSHIPSQTNPSVAEGQQEELKLFNMVAKTTFNYNRKPALVITHADNPLLRNSEGISRLDALVQNQDLEKLKRLYQRATSGYQNAVGGVNKSTTFLMADDRSKESVLFYPELTKPLVRDKIHRELQQEHHQEALEQLKATRREDPQTWWQAAIHYLRAVTPTTIEAESP